MTWMEISAVSIALAFIVLVVFTVRVLIAAKRALHQLSDTVARTEQHVAKTAGEAEQLLKQAGQLTEEVHIQVLALEPTIQSIEKTGAAIGDIASVLRKGARMMNESLHGAERVVHTHHKRIQDVMEWATTGYELWQRWQANRKAKSDH
ncbi:DUF948 domain-containing protein [Paenibacillus aceris]|uniref:Uncharacterized protein YoxC n=1 Tax=Paenibacillus aceris TaxID=869555 RepID=A0ABS4HY31_9BACL|nr:DUF948 domain-containing protein [Paenibacillus aceris]MBP1963537.1 uncharacterized protein YoxC [Paenibacillus aceris]NHW36801.1 DUF948 domain-containing protein [Paenibacillus aceris]